MDRKVVPKGILSSGHGVWIRLNGDPQHDESTYELGLVYASDDAPLSDAAARLHPEFDGNWDNDEIPNFFELA